MGEDVNAEKELHILADARHILAGVGQLTATSIVRLMVRHRAAFKPTMLLLEKNKLIRTGAYMRLMERGFKVQQAIKRVREMDEVGE